MKAARRPLGWPGLAQPRAPRWTSTPATPPVDPATARAEAERRSRLLTMAELGAYLRYTGSDPGHSAYNYVKRHDLPIIKRGTLTLVRLGVIDDHLEAQRRDIAGRAVAAMGKRR